MAQSDLLAGINGVIRRTIESRTGAEDRVEWATAVVPTYFECPGGHTDFEFALGFVAKVYCPETEMTLVCNLIHRLGANDEEIADWINHWWDNVTVERMAEVLEDERAGAGSDTPEG